MAKLDPRVVSVWRWTVAFWGLAATVGGTLASWIVLHERGWLVVAAAPALLAVVAAALVWKAPAAVWSHWSYELGDQALELAHGALFREHSVIPWSRVQHVDISHGPLDRRYGLAQLKVHTASAKSDAKLPGVDAEDAEGLREEILRRYGQTVGD